MRRRALLASLAVGAISLSAGCASDGTGTPTDQSHEPTDGPTTTVAPTEDRSNTPFDRHTSMRVEDVTVQQGYVVREVADAIGVVGDDRRYVWAKISLVGAAAARDSFALETGTASVAPLPDPRAYRFQTSNETGYWGSGGGYLLFELPNNTRTQSTENVPTMAITAPEGTRELDRATAARIASPPPTFSVTIEKRYAETPTEPVAVAVTNDGDVDGRFVGALNRKGPRVEITPVQRVAVDVPAGETRMVAIADDWHDRTSEGTQSDDGLVVEYDLNWAGGSANVSFDEV